MEVNSKTLDKYLEKKEFVKILQVIGSNYNSIVELFYVVQAYLGLGRFDYAEKLLISWQSKLVSSEDWAAWCYYYAKSLFGMKNKTDALTTLNFAMDFIKTNQKSDLAGKINSLKTEITTTFY